MGELVEFFDPNGDNLKNISKYAGKRYRAIVGVQTFAFSVELKDGSNLHDLFIGPKFNIFSGNVRARRIRCCEPGQR